MSRIVCRVDVTQGTCTYLTTTHIWVISEDKKTIGRCFAADLFLHEDRADWTVALRIDATVCSILPSALDFVRTLSSLLWVISDVDFEHGANKSITNGANVTPRGSECILNVVPETQHQFHSHAQVSWVHHIELKQMRVKQCRIGA